MSESFNIYRVFESQRRTGIKKDWVTTVLSDLEELKWDINLENEEKLFLKNC